MIKNVFLTGKPHTGKSIVIDAVVRELALNPGGFRTVRSKKACGSFSVHILDAAEPALLDEGNRVALCDSQKYAAGFIAFPNIFDTAGVQLLSYAKKSGLIIMDELGFMETDAILFQKAVMESLGNDIPVLGVIKKADSDFLSEIRKRADVKVIDLDLCNRKYVEELAGKLIKLYIKKQKNSPA